MERERGLPTPGRPHTPHRPPVERIWALCRGSFVNGAGPVPSTADLALRVPEELMFVLHLAPRSRGVWRRGSAQPPGGRALLQHVEKGDPCPLTCACVPEGGFLTRSFVGIFVPGNPGQHVGGGRGGSVSHSPLHLVTHPSGLFDDGGSSQL